MEADATGTLTRARQWFAARCGALGKGAFSLVALALLVIHVFWPGVRVDSVSIVLLGLAAAPWILDRIDRLRAGDLEIDLRDLRERLEEVKSESEEATEARLPEEGATPDETWLDEFWSADNFVTLSFELRYSIETLIRELATTASIGFGGGRVALLRTLRSLAENGVLPQDLAHALADLVPILNRGVHGEGVSPEKLEWVARAGRDTVRALAGYVKGYASQSVELERAILSYVAEGTADQVNYRVSDVRWARANDGAWWATALVDGVDRDLDQALVIMKRNPGGEWVGVDFGTGVDEDELPQEVRSRLWNR